MYLFKVLTLILICGLLVNAKKQSNVDDLHFTFPEFTIEAHAPKGLRVSIPDVKGIQLFAFHGNINKMLENIDAGDLSIDIAQKVGGRWTFEDKNIKLKPGDTIYFWLYVIRHGLGFRLDGQTFEIQKLLPQPENWSKRPTTKPPRPSYQPKPTPRPVEPIRSQGECKCPIFPPCPVPPTTTTTTPSPKQDIPSVTPSVTDTIVNIWAESLNNATAEKIDLLNKINYLTSQNEHVFKLLELSDNPDLSKLVVSGRIPPAGDPEEFVNNLLREKLMIHERVLSAERDSNNNIVFEMTSFKSKMNVLYAVKEKLKFSQIVITDALLKID